MTTPYVFKEYEIKCQETFAWYPGRILDLIGKDSENKQMLVGYENDWKEAAVVPLEDVRPAPIRSTIPDWDPQVNELAEAQARSEKSEPYGWWACKIQTSKDGYFLINFDGWGEMHNEILHKDMLRPRNKAKNLEYLKRNLGKRRVKVDKTLLQWAMTETDQLCRYLKPMRHILTYSFDPKNCEVLLIGDKAHLPKAVNLLEVTLNNKLELHSLENEARLRQEELEREKKKYQNSCKEEFNIADKSLIRYIFGTKGKNIKEAKKIDGILRVEVDDKKTPATCTIYAKAGYDWAAQQARELLEIFMKLVPVPQDYMGSIIGAKGVSIKKIEADSGVMYIRAWEKFCTMNNRDPNDRPEDSDSENEEEMRDLRQNLGQKPPSYFVIIGTQEAVNAAKSMIKQKIRHKRRQEKIFHQKAAWERELEEYRGQQPGDGYGGPRGGGFAG